MTDPFKRALNQTAIFQNAAPLNWQRYRFDTRAGERGNAVTRGSGVERSPAALPPRFPPETKLSRRVYAHIPTRRPP